MKINILLVLAVSAFGFNACNNSHSSSSSGDTMTASSHSMDTMAMDNSKMTDTAMMANEMMNAMEPSMAKMQSMKMSGDFDQDFANTMFEHHQGAIDMAKVELAKGTDKKMKAMAQNIMTKQSAEQNQLKDLLKNFKSSEMKHGEGKLHESMIGMSSKMKSVPMSGNIDKDFAAMMIPHHQAAVFMFKMELENGMNSKLKHMAEMGIKDQQREIAEFKSWLSANSK